jgi:hypothetical protein
MHAYIYIYIYIYIYTHTGVLLTLIVSYTSATSIVYCSGSRRHNFTSLKDVNVLLHG